MLIEIVDAQLQTWYFGVIFLIGLILSFRGFTKDGFSPETTEQIKGFAVLAIFFAHLGYGLSADQRFLFPLSVLGGVGVNIFLILSGFGLTMSQIRKPLTMLQFYKKRLIRLFLPMWIVLIVLLITDALVLKRSFALTEIVGSFLGFFPRADLSTSLDSPLWYFTIILFYYLLYPIFFNAKYPFLTIVGLVGAAYLLLNFGLPVHRDTLNLYKLHTLAFPAGVMLALIQSKISFKLPIFLRVILILCLIGVVGYTALESGVGKGLRIEQGISLVTAFGIIIIFVFSKMQFGLFGVFGKFSYEVYLVHWPLVSLYLVSTYRFLPPFIAVILSLSLSLISAFGISRVEKFLSQKIKFLN